MALPLLAGRSTTQNKSNWKVSWKYIYWGLTPIHLVKPQFVLLMFFTKEFLDIQLKNRNFIQSGNRKIPIICAGNVTHDALQRRFLFVNIGDKINTSCADNALKSCRIIARYICFIKFVVCI